MNNYELFDQLVKTNATEKKVDLTFAINCLKEIQVRQLIFNEQKQVESIQAAIDILTRENDK